MKTEDGEIITVRQNREKETRIVDLTLDERQMDIDSEVESSVQPSESQNQTDKTSKSDTALTSDTDSTPCKSVAESVTGNSSGTEVENLSKSSKKDNSETPAKTAASKTNSSSTTSENLTDKGTSEVHGKEKDSDQSKLIKDKSDEKGDEERVNNETKSENQDDDKDKSKVTGKEIEIKLDKNEQTKHMYTEMKEEDVKPDKDKLDNGLSVPKSDDTEMKDTIEEKKVFIHKGSQTVPTVVKFASPKEVDLLKLCPMEQKQVLLQKVRELDDTKKDLNDTQTTLKTLQDNIWHLLKIIVPDFDYGNPENIENIILDFIRVNGEETETPSTSGK